LAAFLGKPEGSVLARTEVTREVNAYIRSQKLQDKDNGRKINPDAKLLKLLKLKKGDELTYFNLQKYMAAHFAKSTPAVAGASTPAAGAAAVKA
jgi:chromatin remodeling complex protein RSC6